MTAPPGEAGFTLVEMLVSLGLLAVAALLLAEGFASSRGLGLAMEARNTAGETVAAAQRLLRARIEQAHPATRYEASTPVVDLEGTPDHLDFIAPPLGSGDVGEVRRQHLWLTPAGDLDLTARPLRTPAEAAGEDHVLLRRVAGIDLAYFGAAAPGGARAWRTDWTHSASPPELVRLRARFGAGDRRVWPELIVRPGATVDSQCVLDPANGGCRGRA